ncbi:MAG: hypothetical protein RR728_07545 [Oscillospiraceae bacterium]
MRTFDRQIAPLRCGSGSAALIVLCTMNLWYNNLMGGATRADMKSATTKYKCFKQLHYGGL